MPSIGQQSITDKKIFTQYIQYYKSHQYLHFLQHFSHIYCSSYCFTFCIMNIQYCKPLLFTVNYSEVVFDKLLYQWPDALTTCILQWIEIHYSNKHWYSLKNWFTEKPQPDCCKKKPRLMAVV
jgi:hypothetical protein